MKHITGFALAAALLLTQCKSELDGKPAAKVAEAKGADTKGADAGKGADVKPQPTGDAKTFKLDAGASKIGFVGRKLTGDHTGDFKTFSGGAKVAGKEP